MTEREQAEAEAEAGRVIHQRYRIIRRIGRGGVATTYEAEDLSSKRRVAVKELVLRGMRDWKILDLFERESEVLAKLDDPNVPRYIDHFHTEETDGGRRFYIVQELAPGRSLDQLVAEGWRPSTTVVREIAVQLLETLCYLHSHRPPVIHRDIKPQNVVRDEEGKVFLVDFGAVQHRYLDTVTGGSTIVGTYGYMAPEQVRGQTVPASDLYSLGATLLFLLARKPISELPHKRNKIDIRATQVSGPLARWLNRMLEPTEEDRYATAARALVGLHNPPRLSRSTRRVLIPTLVVANLALLGGVGAFLARGGGEQPLPAPPQEIRVEPPRRVALKRRAEDVHRRILRVASSEREATPTPIRRSREDLAKVLPGTSERDLLRRPGPNNRSLRIEGLKRFCQSSSSRVLTPTGDAKLTLEAWIKLLRAPRRDPGPGLIRQARVPLVRLMSSYSISLYLYDGKLYGAGQSTALAAPAGGIIPGRWHHVAVTMDDEVDQLTLYLDGVRVGSNRAWYAGNTTGESAYLLIGSRPQDTSGRGFAIRREQPKDVPPVLIDEVRLWKLVRPARRIRAAMRYELSGRERGLAGYWPLNKGVGQIIRDRTAGGNDGWLGSSPAVVDKHDPSWSRDSFSSGH